MLFRTDLASELTEDLDEIKGIKEDSISKSGAKITKISILTEDASKKVGKPVGDYISISLPSLSKASFDLENYSKIICDEIKKFLPKDGLVFVVGLGNLNVTPDSLGPKSCKKIIATRHIKEEIKTKHTRDDSLRSVAVLSPGVLGQTGIETSELVKSISRDLKPNLIILIDALASRSLKNLGRVIQISNTGISPGSGVGSSRPLIDANELGANVMSIGMPMVVDAKTLAADILGITDESTKKIKKENENMMVTPKDIDILIERSSKLVSSSVNLALHKGLKYEDLT